MDTEYILADPVRRGNYKVIKKMYPDEYELVIKQPGQKFIEKLYNYLFPDARKTCIICGRSTKFKNIREGYNEACCHRCACQNPKRQEQIKKTTLEHYGVDNISKLDSIKEKKEQTTLGHYGVKHFNNRDKASRTMSERYGVNNISKLDSIKEKKKQTKLNRYGDENYTNQEKSKQTCLERYGVDNIFKIKEVRDRAKHNFYDRFFRDNELVVSITNNIYTCRCPHPECTKCQERTFQIPNHLYNTRKYGNIELCTKLLSEDRYRFKNTLIERFVKDILDDYHIQYIENDRSILDGQELDIYIPSKNLAIECNGIRWHSDIFKKSTYHYNKYLKCKEGGIQLITIWEDWLMNKPIVVKSMLLNKLGLSPRRIFARKCNLIYIKSGIANNFLDRNHIQGSTKASIYVGLEYKGEIVSVMTFNKRRGCIGNDNSWELSRFCNVVDTVIVGAASRLLKEFRRNHKEQIVSFSSNDVSNGNLYRQLGFTETTTSIPYWYIDNKYHRYHRTSFTKSAIVKRGWKDKNDNSWTENEVTHEHDLYKIYDSGLTKFILS